MPTNHRQQHFFFFKAETKTKTKAETKAETNPSPSSSSASSSADDSPSEKRPAPPTSPHPFFTKKLCTSGIPSRPVKFGREPAPWPTGLEHQASSMSPAPSNFNQASSMSPAPSNFIPLPAPAPSPTPTLIDYFELDCSQKRKNSCIKSNSCSTSSASTTNTNTNPKTKTKTNTSTPANFHHLTPILAEIINACSHSTFSHSQASTPNPHHNHNPILNPNPLVFLLHGPPGAGKSLLAEHLLPATLSPPRRLLLLDSSQPRTPRSFDPIQAHLQHHSPASCLLLVDGVECLFAGSDRGFPAALNAFLAQEHRGLVVLMTTNWTPGMLAGGLGLRLPATTRSIYVGSLGKRMLGSAELLGNGDGLGNTVLGRGMLGSDEIGTRMLASDEIDCDELNSYELSSSTSSTTAPTTASTLSTPSLNLLSEYFDARSLSHPVTLKPPFAPFDPVEPVDEMLWCVPVIPAALEPEHHLILPPHRYLNKNLNLPQHQCLSPVPVHLARCIAKRFHDYSRSCNRLSLWLQDGLLQHVLDVERWQAEKEESMRRGRRGRRSHYRYTIDDALLSLILASG